MMNPHAYLGLKVIHVASAMVFLGNIVLGLFWKAHADRSKNPVIIAHTMDGIIRSDAVFTVPAVFVIVLGGIGMGIEQHYPILGTGWIFWSIILFSISGLAFGFQVVPLQTRMRAVAREGDGTKFDWTAYRQLSRRWEIWGIVALAAPAIAFAMMVFKPELPGLRELLHLNP